MMVVNGATEEALETKLIKNTGFVCIKRNDERDVTVVMVINLRLLEDFSRWNRT